MEMNPFKVFAEVISSKFLLSPLFGFVLVLKEKDYTVR